MQCQNYPTLLCTFTRALMERRKKKKKKRERERDKNNKN